MAELALEQTVDLGDYLSAFKRRLGVIILVAGIVFILGLITAFVWPPTYQSSSTILIEAQEVPAELIQSTVTSFAAQRIQVISQRVMTRTNLVEIIDEYGLYKDERKRETIEVVLSKMREDISVNMITADVVDPRTGRPAAATIAFTLGFKSENPVQAQKVAGEITTLFLNENLKSRTEKAAETYDFLTAEANRLKDDISLYESQLAEFKELNLNTLPESRSLNEQALARAEQEAASIDTQIQTLKERKIYLEGQLPLLDPYSAGADIMGPGARLDALRTEYIRLSSRYSPDHPDVTSTKREIKALERETGNYASTDDLMARMDLLQQELATVKQLYTHEHPDVKNLKRQIAALQEELDNPPASAASGFTPANPDNPAYVNLQTQLAAADSEIRSRTARRAQLVDRIAEYEERLLQMPKSEQKYRAIVRDLEQASTRYNEIKAKQMTAEVGQEMEKER
ncbi:MAG: Wzz/FepE/Etk N-terminal domain-containing protein, partial [Gammaproteobacteria bacterium]|nr:Wzz/FepE/Etk N-terminal domain-containing protein [Gammaproteobacteria bacterium]